MTRAPLQSAPFPEQESFSKTWRDEKTLVSAGQAFYYNFVILPVKQPCDPRSTSSAFDLDTDGPILQVLGQCTLNRIRCLLGTVASQRVVKKVRSLSPAHGACRA